MSDRIQRAQERLRIAADLYQLGQREGGGNPYRLAKLLCGGARIMAEREGHEDLAQWASDCADLCFEARWSFGGAS